MIGSTFDRQITCQSDRKKAEIRNIYSLEDNNGVKAGGALILIPLAEATSIQQRIIMSRQQIGVVYYATKYPFD